MNNSNNNMDRKLSARDQMFGSPVVAGALLSGSATSRSAAIAPPRPPQQLLTSMEQKNYCCPEGGSMDAKGERNESSEPLLSRLLAEMDLLEEGETAAYKRACEIVPELVASESDPGRYLRVCGGNNVREAATRLALYWKKRFALFGPDRAFLPMTQTGNGALSRDDLECLRTGTWTVLPKDGQGRMVFLHDENLSTKGMDRQEMRLSRFRCVFYVLNSIAADEASRSRGLLLLRKTDQPDFARGRMANFFASLQAHAIHLSAYCLLCLPKSTGAKRMIQNTLIPAMKQNIPQPLRKRTHALVAGSADELRDAIERDAVLNSLDLRGLPPSLGGTWSYENFAHWQLQRLRFERDVHEPKFKATKPPRALPLPAAAGSSNCPMGGLSVLANAVEAVPARSGGLSSAAALPTRKRPPPSRKPQEETWSNAAIKTRRPKLDRSNDEPKSVVAALRRAQNLKAPPPTPTAVDAAAAAEGGDSHATANPVIAALRGSKVAARRLRHQKQELPSRQKTTTTPRPEAAADAAAAVASPPGVTRSGSGSDGAAAWIEEKINQERQLQRVLAAIVSKGGGGSANQQGQVEFPAPDAGRQPIGTLTAPTVGQSASSSGSNAPLEEEVLLRQVVSGSNSALANAIAGRAGSAYGGRDQALRGRLLESRLLQQLQQHPAAPRATAAASAQSQLVELIAPLSAGSVVSTAAAPPAARHHPSQSNDNASSALLIEQLLLAEKVRTEENLRKGKQQRELLLLLLRDALRKQETARGTFFAK